MRKVVLYTLMSLDGAVDDPRRYFPETEVPGAPAFDPVMAGLESHMIAAQDAVLLGRRTYDEWSRYWPTSDEQPFADFINSVKKYVLTSSPLANDWANAEPVNGTVVEAVRDLTSRRGGDIGVHGSIQLAQSLLAEGLVDELHLAVAGYWTRWAVASSRTLASSVCWSWCEPRPRRAAASGSPTACPDDPGYPPAHQVRTRSSVAPHDHRPWWRTRNRRDRRSAHDRRTVRILTKFGPPAQRQCRSQPSGPTG